MLLDSGSALGRNCGPILIKKPSNKLNLDSKIAIPGKNTTANLLLSIAYPEYCNKVEMLFSEIENQILLGNIDAGLIIHENRFRKLKRKYNLMNYDNIDILITPTREYNPWGRDILEAIANGKAVISVGNYDKFVNKNTGLLLNEFILSTDRLSFS